MLVCLSVTLVDVNFKCIINRPYSFTTCHCNRNNEHIFIFSMYFLQSLEVFIGRSPNERRLGEGFDRRFVLR